MEEKRCFRCDILDSQAELMDAIYENEIVKVCEKCAKLESIPVLKKPSNSQIKEADRPYSVYERLALMRGMKEKAELKKQEITQQDKEKKDIEQLKKPADFLKDEKIRPELKTKLDLMDNFHWDIFRERRKKRMTQKELAETVGTSEDKIKALEYGQLTDSSPEIIKKIEDFFDINLRKSIPKKIEKPVLERQLVEETKELEKVEEQGKKALEEEKAIEKKLDISDEKIKEMRISDLQKMKENEVQNKIQEAGKSALSDREVTLADLQERKMREKQETQETQDNEIDWKGKTKEERVKNKEPEKEAEEIIKESEYGEGVELIE